MAIFRSVDPGIQLGATTVISGITGSSHQLVSTSLITAGTRLVAVQVGNLSNNATSAYVCDYSTNTVGMYSSTAICVIGVAASGVNNYEFPVPYKLNSGCLVYSVNSNIATTLVYETTSA